MTPKEKAIQLVGSYRKEMLRGKYRINGFVIEEISEKCALIAVQEIICSNPHSNPLNTDATSTMKWWMDVQEEIEKL